MRNDLVAKMTVDAEFTMVLVLDTSAIINLNATTVAEDILGAFPNDIVVTTQVFDELAAGSMKGYQDYEMLCTLLDAGIVVQSELVGEECMVFRSLVEGSGPTTLGDGESATIAKAFVSNGLAVVDDRKARKIALRRFGKMSVAPTIALLLDRLVEQSLGPAGQVNAVFLALRNARMYVPQENEAQVLGMIGQERAAQCPSLRRELRRKL